MKCAKPGCKVTSPPGTLFRVNEKGVADIYLCRKHLDGYQVDPEVLHIVNVIDGAVSAI